MAEGEESVSHRFIRSVYATYKIISGYGRIKLSELEKEAHVGRSQLFEHLRLLEKAELIRRSRFDRHVYITVMKYVDRDEFENVIRDSIKKKDVYDVAEDLIKEVRKYGLRADLFGTCKIHQEVLLHNRLTNDINVVALREDFNYLELLMRSIGFIRRSASMRICADYIYELPQYKFFALVAIDGVKHPHKDERYFDLSPVLRAKGSIDLEHAVAGKLLIIPNLRRDDDGEDVAYAIAYGDVNLKKLVAILEEVAEKYPDIVPIVRKNVELVRSYLSSKGIFDDYSLLKIKNSLKYIEQNITSEYRANRVSEKVG